MTEIEQFIPETVVTPEGQKITILPPDLKIEEGDRRFSHSLWQSQIRQAIQKEVALRHPLSGNGRAISFGGKVLPEKIPF